VRKLHAAVPHTVVAVLIIALGGFVGQTMSPRAVQASSGCDMMICDNNHGCYASQMEWQCEYHGGMCKTTECAGDGGSCGGPECIE
jgi:hypothetical protein